MTNSADIIDDKMNDVVLKYRPLFYKFLEHFLEPVQLQMEAETALLSTLTSDQEITIEKYIESFIEVHQVETNEEVKMHLNDLRLVLQNKC